MTLSAVALCLPLLAGEPTSRPAVTTQPADIPVDAVIAKMPDLQRAKLIRSLLERAIRMPKDPPRAQHLVSEACRIFKNWMPTEHIEEVFVKFDPDEVSIHHLVGRSDEP